MAIAAGGGVLPHAAAFNVLSHNAAMDPESGYNGEELKFVAEVHRLLDVAALRSAIRGDGE